MPRPAAKNKNAVSPRAATPLAAALRELGFTDYEARAYAALATTQPATAYEIAKKAALPRANVYAALHNLEAKGAIQPVTEKPVRYVPVDPEHFFRSVQRTTAGLCEDVVRAMRHSAKAAESAYVSIFRGEHEVRAKLTDMLERARDHIWLKGPVALIEPLAGALAAAARRGVMVRLIVFGKSVSGLKPHKRIQLIPHEGDGEPHGPPSDRMLTATVDSEAMLIASFAGAVKASFARDYSIVYVIETLLLHEVYLAEIHAAFGKQLDSRFGRQLGRLRRKYRPRGREQPVLAGTEPETP
ncbi:MAG: helix-turn-helix domain-containing protein [Burkholderiales bacterium]|nr:helix-turn-helix domain-containing protein [Burkholderiales bacterium]